MFRVNPLLDMKNQALFSLKDKSKKLKCHHVQFLFGALRFNQQEVARITYFCLFLTFKCMYRSSFAIFKGRIKLKVLCMYVVYKTERFADQNQSSR